MKQCWRKERWRNKASLFRYWQARDFMCTDVHIGVKNMRALSKVIQQQLLGYAYPFHEFDLSTDLGFIVVSRAKSMFPVSHSTNSSVLWWHYLTSVHDPVPLCCPTFTVCYSTIANLWRKRVTEHLWRRAKKLPKVFACAQVLRLWYSRSNFWGKHTIEGRPVIRTVHLIKLFQHIQQRFVESRKEASSQSLPLPTQEDLMLQLNLARYASRPAH